MATIDDLIAIMARLRDPQTGCAWDVKQDFDSIAAYTIEEAGGAVLALDGRPLACNTRDSLLNPEFLACGDARTDWARLFAAA